MLIKKFTTIILLINFFLLLKIAAAAIYPSNLKWKMIQSQHFNVVFHQGEGKAAMELIDSAEEAYDKIALFWNNDKLPNKIYILLIDTVDFSNGSSTIFPYNSIIIYLRPPSGEGFLGNNENWLKTVIIHELMHIIHLNQSEGIFKFSQYLFGRNPLLFPNIFQPLWLIEGLATYAETKWTSKGRGRAADVNMIFKIAAINNKLPSPDQISGPLVKWPWHNASYFFGFSFLKYLSEAYPENYIYKFNKYNSSIIPFNIEKAFKKTYGKDFNTLWKEWQAYMKKKYQPSGSLAQSYNMLHKRGYYIFQPIFSADASKLYYSITDPHNFPKICQLNISTGKENCFLDRYYGTTLSSDKEHLYFSQIERYNSFYIYSDIYAYYLNIRKLKRLTFGLRAKDPISVNDEIVFVKNGPYSSGIYSINKTKLPCQAKQCKIKEILPEKEGVEYSNPKWNNKNKMFVAAKWEKGGIMSIIIFNENGNIIDQIGNDNHRYLSPIWTSDGENILFSSDLSGSFNIYSYSLKDKKFCKITNEDSGAFYPAISNNKLAYVKYYQNGFELAIIDLENIKYDCQIYEAISKKIESKSSKYAEYEMKNYSAFPLLIPKFWMPLFSSKAKELQIGIFTFGQDLLYHSYSLFLYYGYYSRKFSYEFNYTYDRFYPTIGLRLKKELEWYSENNYSANKKTNLFMLIPFYKIKWRIYGVFNLEQEELLNKFQNDYFNLEFNWISFELGYDSKKKYDYSISFTDGRNISIFIKTAINKGEIGGSLYKAEGKWNEYIHLFWKHHILALRFSYGRSWGSSKYRAAYFIGSSSADSDNFLLRGYRENFLITDKAYALNIEYRFPFWNIEKGKGNLPIFLQRFHIDFFLDVVRAFDYNRGWIINKGVGGELSLDISIIYQLKLTLTLGFAKGMDNGGTNKIYFRFGPSF